MGVPIAMNCKKSLTFQFKLYRSSINPINVIIGPEGGFSENELGVMEKKGITFFSLGNRRLRSETAAITSLVLLNKIAEIT